ncbi:cytidine deaminase [Corynebacterium freiburgense]|uniref:cytidine deaminase n=1 Tax=Corynebacterium freiburgense TaxID=556548 RepID=UPI000411FF5F|nr:cytidine deaminase [Corynebacterium freiburgense]WJZ03339.1 Cytidine deaminase [Corynebacterium freiburgense]
MSPTDYELIELAHEAAEHAYAPYSQFPVGAALLLDDGRVITGCNVENASYGLTICAERNAVTRAIVTSEDAPGTGNPERMQIKAVAIVGLRAEPCYPCGACLQVLSEFNCERVIVAKNKESHSIAFAELLPYAFWSDSL